MKILYTILNSRINICIIQFFKIILSETQKLLDDYF